MKEPLYTNIAFKEEFIPAILDGRKTQTRRVMKVQPPDDRYQLMQLLDGNTADEGKFQWGIYSDYSIKKVDPHFFAFPFGEVGDRLRIKGGVILEITDFRAERVQDITEEGAKAEGLQDYKERFNIERSGSITWYARHAFVTLWNKIYGEDAFLENPFVWVVEFKRCEACRKG